MKRPLLITDCDEVLMHMVVPFREWLDEVHDVHFSFENQDFVNALRRKSCGTVLEQGEVWTLLRAFFRTEMARQTPIDGAIAALHRISKAADIVVLTNIGEDDHARRVAQLHAIGLDFPVLWNQGGKGKPVQRLIKRYQPSAALFVDDLGAHHESVATHAPQVWRLHMVGEPEIAPGIAPSPHAHQRIDLWAQAERWVEERLSEGQAARTIYPAGALHPADPAPVSPAKASESEAGAAPSRLSFLTRYAFAHRGLHHAAGPAENSLPAFRAALNAGYGAECDVRLSADAIPFVFHDATMDRMTDASGPIGALPAATLDRTELRDGSGPLPRLSALLSLAGKAMPLLIELKVDTRAQIAPLCRAVLADLAKHEGPVAVIAFHPMAIRWLRTHAPAIPRGLVMADEERKGWFHNMRHALAIRYADPDFLACDIRDLPSPLARAFRQKGKPVLSWTVRTETERETAASEADAIIFEQPGQNE